MTQPRELRVGDLVRCNKPGTSQREYAVSEFVVMRSYVTRDGVHYAKDTLSAVLVSSRPPVLRTTVRLDRIDTSGKPRRSGWSLVTGNSVTFIEENGGGPGVRLRGSECALNKSQQ